MIHPWITKKKGFTGTITGPATRAFSRYDINVPLVLTRGAFDKEGIKGHESKDAYDISIRGLSRGQVLLLCAWLHRNFSLVQLVRPDLGNGVWHIHAAYPFPSDMPWRTP